MAADDGKPDLSAFQLEVARLFFALPASQGFLLAGGAALLAQHLTARATEDLDFFTAPRARSRSRRARCPGGRSQRAGLVRAANP
jgi:Nucleotidyl transferase AbiEii toxin, Type IV TA system